MRRFFLIGFLVLMAFDTLCQISFKFAANGMGPASFDPRWLEQVVFQPWIYVALLGYVGAFFTYMTLLKHAPIGPAFAASHLEIVSVTVISVLFLGETLSFIQMAGAILIVAGILVLGFGEHREEEQHSSP